MACPPDGDTVIVVDSSALIATLQREPEAGLFLAMLSETDRCLISAVTSQETSIVMAGRAGTRDPFAELDALVSAAGIEVSAHDERLARVARDAFLRFGKGRHPAGLNMGDCASYALARQTSVALLYKGRDFAKTDIASALPAGR